MIEKVTVLIGPSESGQTTQVTLHMERHDEQIFSNTRNVHVFERHADAAVPYALSILALEIAKAMDKQDGTGIFFKVKPHEPDLPTPSPS